MRMHPALRMFIAIVTAAVAGCAAAMPFQPNANASNTATNKAEASPNVSVNLQPNQQPVPATAATPPTTSAPSWIR